MAHVPPLGFGVYQLLEGLNTETILADYNLYHTDKSKPVKPQRIFNIKEIQNALDEIMLENSYMKVWFSGSSGLLEVCMLSTWKYLIVNEEMGSFNLIFFSFRK